MASTKEYLEYVLEQLSGIDGLRYRPMMGEYLIYCRNRLVGGVYDDRLLVKPTKSALALLPDAPREEPYPGGRPMLLVTEMENKRLLRELLEAVAKSRGFLLSGGALDVERASRIVLDEFRGGKIAKVTLDRIPEI